MAYPEDQELQLIASAPDELPTLDLANAVSAALAKVISHVSLPAGEQPSPRLHAVWFMTIQCFRALRAASWVVKIGYEDQALGYVRVVDELFNRSQKVCEDESGEYARQWLADKGPGKPAKLTDKAFWEITSGPPHSTVRAVLDWQARSAEGRSTEIIVGPERVAARANATLTHLSYEAAAVAWRLSTEAGLDVEWARLFALIKESMDMYLPDEDATAGPVSAESPPSAPAG